MAEVTTFVWPGFRLEIDAAAGTVTTRYPGGHWSGGPVVADDHEHAALLGVSAFRHRQAHELAHHVAALALGAGTPETGCPIIFAAARGLPTPADAAALEWTYTALTYYAFGAMMRAPGDWGALIDVERAGVDAAALAARFRWLLDAVTHAESVTVVAA